MLGTPIAYLLQKSHSKFGYIETICCSLVKIRDTYVISVLFGSRIEQGSIIELKPVKFKNINHS